MPEVTRLGDIGSGHDLCPPRALATASDNVFINKKGAGRVGDSYVAHACEIHPPHDGNIAVGSATVFVNKKNLARIGDGISCGGAVIEGSPNVFAGG